MMLVNNHTQNNKMLDFDSKVSGIPFFIAKFIKKNEKNTKFKKMEKLDQIKSSTNMTINEIVAMLNEFQIENETLEEIINSELTSTNQENLDYSAEYFKLVSKNIELQNNLNLLIHARKALESKKINSAVKLTIDSLQKVLLRMAVKGKLQAEILLVPPNLNQFSLQTYLTYEANINEVISSEWQTKESCWFETNTILDFYDESLVHLKDERLKNQLLEIIEKIPCTFDNNYIKKIDLELLKNLKILSFEIHDAENDFDESSKSKNCWFTPKFLVWIGDRDGQNILGTFFKKLLDAKLKNLKEVRFEIIEARPCLHWHDHPLEDELDDYKIEYYTKLFQKYQKAIECIPYIEYFRENSFIFEFEYEFPFKKIHALKLIEALGYKANIEFNKPCAGAHQLIIKVP